VLDSVADKMLALATVLRPRSLADHLEADGRERTVQTLDRRLAAVAGERSPRHGIAYRKAVLVAPRKHLGKGVTSLSMRAVTRRATASLNIQNSQLVRWLFEKSQGTWLGPSRTPQTTELRSEGLKSGRAEFEDGERFFRHFHGQLTHDDLRDKTVLDVGCGYGGRTVFYAEICGAKSAHGVETTKEKVERCSRLAKELGSAKTSFSVGLAEDLPFPDGTFDTVVSFDVLEHCDDPRAAVNEIARVLRPGGQTWNVFPTYKGARSSHLAYINSLPLIHRVFHPDTLIDVANELLEQETNGNRPGLQPRPSWSSLGHYTLPRLNGMTLKEARRIFGNSGLSCDFIVTPLIDPQLSWEEMKNAVGSSRIAAATVFTAAHGLSGWQRVLPLPEFLVQNIAVCGSKP
jgi:SAM-dependent methyltransferase